MTERIARSESGIQAQRADTNVREQKSKFRVKLAGYYWSDSFIPFDEEHVAYRAIKAVEGGLEVHPDSQAVHLQDHLSDEDI